MAALEHILEHMLGRGDVWIARRDAIARHWLGTAADQPGA